MVAWTRDYPLSSHVTRSDDGVACHLVHARLNHQLGRGTFLTLVPGTYKPSPLYYVRKSAELTPPKEEA